MKNKLFKIFFVFLFIVIFVVNGLFVGVRNVEAQTDATVNRTTQGDFPNELFEGHDYLATFRRANSFLRGIINKKEPERSKFLLDNNARILGYLGNLNNEFVDWYLEDRLRLRDGSVPFKYRKLLAFCETIEDGSSEGGGIFGFLTPDDSSTILKGVEPLRGLIGVKYKGGKESPYEGEAEHIPPIIKRIEEVKAAIAAMLPNLGDDKNYDSRAKELIKKAFNEYVISLDLMEQILALKRRALIENVPKSNKDSIREEVAYYSPYVLELAKLGAIRSSGGNKWVMSKFHENDLTKAALQRIADGGVKITVTKDNKITTYTPKKGNINPSNNVSRYTPIPESSNVVTGVVGGVMNWLNNMVTGGGIRAF